MNSNNIKDLLKGQNIVLSAAILNFDSSGFEPPKTIECYLIKKDTPLMIWVLEANRYITLYVHESATKDILIPKQHPSISLGEWDGVGHLIITYNSPVHHPRYKGEITKWAVAIKDIQYAVKEVPFTVTMNYDIFGVDCYKKP